MSAAKMGVKVYLSTAGRPLDPQQATISVFDRGFLYGDSVYETLRTARGKCVEQVRHLARLRQSAAGIGLGIPFTDADIVEAIEQTLVAAQNDESSVRIVVTRGTSALTIDPRESTTPLLVVYVTPLKRHPPELYSGGLSVRIVDVRKTSHRSLDASLKTGNYLNNIQALRQAHHGDAQDAIMLNHEGAVAEGATSNVFIVAGGQLLTPSLKTGVLNGITRAVICELAESLGHPVHETTIWPKQLRAADEVFLTSSVRGAVPVTTIDGAPVNDGRVGPLTERLIEHYRRHIGDIDPV